MKYIGVCSKCGRETRYYDMVKRIVRSNKGIKKVKVPRYICLNCGEIHRLLPECIFPYKQYDVEIIKGVLEGFITCETYGYEDYPCEMTMIRWKNTRDLQLLL